jgi:hypothetical protein
MGRLEEDGRKQRDQAKKWGQKNRLGGLEIRPAATARQRGENKFKLGEKGE